MMTRQFFCGQKYGVKDVVAVLMNQLALQTRGRWNFRVMTLYTGVSHLWLDGALWMVYLRSQGLPFWEIGLFEALLHLVSVVFDIPAGIFGDRVGWKWSLLVGAACGVLYAVAMLHAQRALWLFTAAAARGLQSTFTSGCDASIVYQSAVTAGEEEGYLRISGRLYAVALLALGIASAAGGMVASVSWTDLYAVMGVTNALAALCVLLVHEPTHTVRGIALEQEGGQRVSPWQIVREAVAFASESRPFMGWIVCSAVLGGFVATLNFYGQSLLRDAGFSLVAIGILYGTQALLGAYASTRAQHMERRFGENRTMAFAGVGASVGLLLFCWLPGIFSGLGYLLDNSASDLMTPIISRGLNRIVPQHARATLLSAESTGFSLVMIIGFPLLGWFVSVAGLGTAAKITSVVGAVAIVGVTWLRHRWR